LTDIVYCEARSGLKGVEFAETLDNQSEWPHSWPDGIISYRLNNKSPDFDHSWQKKAVTIALRAWQWRVDRIKFRRERNPDTHVDFNVWWRSLEEFQSANVFAHAYFPGQGDISGDVEINDNWDWVPGSHLQTLANPPLVPVMIHEFGHSLGLRHDTLITSTEEIMYPSFNLGRKKYKLGPRTVQRIQERYGARTISQRVIDFFALRRLLGSDFR